MDLHHLRGDPVSEDLDRAYVINGSDIHIVLKQNQWVFNAVSGEHTGRLKYPRDVAEVILDEARPLDDLPRVTVNQLADALDGLPFWVRHVDHPHSKAIQAVPVDPEDMARDMHDALTRQQALSGGAAVLDASIRSGQPLTVDDDEEPEPARKRGYYDGKTGMQPFDVVDEFGLDFYEGNVVKYIVRWRKKNGVDDLRKARTYIEALIKRAEADPYGVTEPPF